MPERVSIHDSCHELLPWYVNDTLEPAECLRVEEHLELCESCRDELAALEDLRRSVREEPVPLASNEFAGVMARIDAAQSRPMPHRRWMPWLLAGQAAAIAALLLLLLARPVATDTPERFHTLASPTVEPRGATLRIVFAETATEVEIRGLLQTVEAEIVGGPSSAGAYTLRLPGGRVAGPAAIVDTSGDADVADVAERVSRLREHALVRLVEWVAPRAGSGGPPGG